MIIEALTRIGNTIRLRNVKELLVDLPQGTDLVWHYGDLQWIEQHIEAARQAKVPIIVNSSYDNLPDRRQWMMHQLQEWDPEDKGDVLLGVFSNGISYDPRLHRIWHRLIPIPKTIRIHHGDNPPFGARSGICLGEIEKLGTRRITDGHELICRIIDHLRDVLPNVPLYAFNQYANKDTPALPGVTTVPYQEEGFLPWLSGLRLYLSLTPHETFSMVPAEAQSVGTPVIYRHMPQSLTEHLGHTGFMARSVEDMVMAARTLYLCEQRWEQMRLMSIRNAKARSIEHVGVVLDLALRRALTKGELIW